MADESSTAGSTRQPSDKKGNKGLRALISSRLFLRKRREMMLSRMRHLTTSVFNETVQRLEFGETAHAVTEWLMTQDRGPLANLNFFTLRNYVVNLRLMLRIKTSQKARQHREANIRRMARFVRAEQVHNQNVVEMRRAQQLAKDNTPEPAPPTPEDIRELQNQIRGVLKNVSEYELNKFVWLLAYKRYELCKPLEDTAKVPVQALSDLQELMIKAADACTRARRVDLLAQKQRSNAANLDAIIIDGGELHGKSSSKIASEVKSVSADDDKANFDKRADAHVPDGLGAAAAKVSCLT